VRDGGVLVDLSQMQSVVIDPGRGIATIEPGVTGEIFDAAAQEHGLATPTPTVSSVGVIGAALGGGGGYLTRKYGLTLDNVISAEIVTADGEVLHVSEHDHPDLFWAIRGGGGNYGIVTSMELQLHRVGPEVFAGQVIYPFDDAARLLRSVRDFMDEAPDEFQCYPFCFRVPPIDLFPAEHHGQPVLDLVMYHEDATAADFVQPLRQLAGGPILDLVGPSTYVDVQKSFDANLPKGNRYLSKAHDLAELSDGAIDVMVEFVPRMAGAFTAAYFDPVGGAAGRIGVTETAYAGRQAKYGFHIIAGWQDDIEDDPVIGWANEFHDAMSPHATGGVYVNLIGDNEMDRIPAAYGPNYPRLVELKKRWDPTNLFSGNYNIEPG
jgi:FAD/FMN-containing dehydrogenase